MGGACRGWSVVEVGTGRIAASSAAMPVLRETGLTLEVDHPMFGRIVRHGLPVAFSETPGRVEPSCLRGEHNHDILSGAGYAPHEIDALRAEGVVFDPDPLPE